MARQPKETISLALLLTDGGPALAAAIDAVGGLIIVADDGEVTIPVSYTHLTLPTICSV